MPRMSRTTAIRVSLPPMLTKWMDERLAEGGFESHEEYIRHLIRKEASRREQEALESRLLQAIDSGPATPMTKSDWNAIKNRIRRRAAASTNGRSRR